ncbi:hypothetical protein QBC47DRAFT_403214 [Echria macrotheca]|uniref:GPI anchored protein n=1 Tax=Echria macrotheca TaxID=438768 RepID=A0AAJ0BAQ2_9PEZI|nr:hypothetical protein QBC47DRAFT_403214 [Echria macrotheca]
MRLPHSLWALLALQLDAALSQQPQPDQPIPTAIRKMPPDQGAKFHESYYAFAPVPDQQQDDPLRRRPRSPLPAIPDVILARSAALSGNSSLSPEPGRFNFLLPPFAVLSLDEPEPESGPGVSEQNGGDSRRIRRSQQAAAAGVLAHLEKRQWACPTGTSGCGAIGYPNSCCQDGETCVLVADTGLGPVGCCPAGSSCAGNVMACTGGSTPCGSDVGGGCCIPGYVCQGPGCVVSQAPSPSPSPAPPPPPPPPGVTTITSTSTSIIDSPTPSTVIVTVIVTISPPAQSPPRTSTVTQTVSPSSTDTGIGAPYRPTSSSTNGIATYCPTGFYACLASAGGGCCQTGRDCHTTSCPPVAMTTIVTANGVTVVVPASGVPAAATTGQCAGGWFLCGREAGPVPGCCPEGYSCGTASCSVVTGGATATVAKELPGGASLGRGMGVGWRGFVWGMVGWLVVVLLVF